jgi:hypothetical protein
MEKRMQWLRSALNDIDAQNKPRAVSASVSANASAMAIEQCHASSASGRGFVTSI